jgi:hypothetical protein
MSMQATENKVKMAAQLYQYRDAARSMLGGEYATRMAEMGAAIKHVAGVKGISDMSAAIELAQQTSGFGTVIVLAAVVELTEPTT